MKLIVKIQCDKFPIMYQMLGVSLIKQALGSTSSTYCDQLYKFEDNKSNKKAKNFCFAFKVVDYKLQKEEFDVKGEVVLIISSPDNEFMLRVYNGLIQNRNFKYNNYELNIKNVFIKDHKTCRRLQVVLKTQSPIWIKNNVGQSVEIDDAEYQKEFNYICDKVLEAYRGYGLRSELNFEPVNMRRKVVKQYIREFKDATNKDIFYTNCYEGIFKLYGDVDDINDLIQLGFGFKRSQGYGLVELL
ncbi:MAG: CRISPR-associated endoribonuclease Cas6 [Epulopiscium sp. Nele67-Bin004]|nr:MAG: CRISPR-associated endoribonuclease Cas6 [Epulopiscium sp. Nele67-Bin004]